MRKSLGEDVILEQVLKSDQGLIDQGSKGRERRAVQADQPHGSRSRYVRLHDVLGQLGPGRGRRGWSLKV